MNTIDLMRKQPRSLPLPTSRHPRRATTHVQPAESFLSKAESSSSFSSSFSVESREERLTSQTRFFLSSRIKWLRPSSRPLYPHQHAILKWDKKRSWAPVHLQLVVGWRSTRTGVLFLFSPLLLDLHPKRFLYSFAQVNSVLTCYTFD